MLEAGRLRLGDPLHGEPRRVAAVEHREYVVARRLHAEADAGEAGVAQLTQRCRVDRFGVGFRRHLSVGRQAELLIDGRQHRGKVGDGQHGRRATTEKHCLHWQFGGTEYRAGKRDFSDRVGGVRRLARAAAELGSRVRIEVAVPAPRRAVGHVHIDAERSPPHAGPDVGGQRSVGGQRVAVRQG